jgi:6-phosphogluconate dehydrogenase
MDSLDLDTPGNHGNGKWSLLNAQDDMKAPETCEELLNRTILEGEKERMSTSKSSRSSWGRSIRGGTKRKREGTGRNML